MIVFSSKVQQRMNRPLTWVKKRVSLRPHLSDANKHCILFESADMLMYLSQMTYTLLRRSNKILSNLSMFSTLLSSFLFAVIVT